MKKGVIFNSFRNAKILRRVVAWLCLIFLIGIIGYEIKGLTQKNDLPDFVAFWSAGRLNAQGYNPYDPSLLLRLQKEIGWVKEEPERWWSPPLSLLLYMPFGILNYPIARVLWQLMQLALILLCADWLWRFYEGPITYRWLALPAALFFFPTLYTIQEGQNAGFILLGVVGFLNFIKKGKACLAGACIFLGVIKPHILYLFWIALTFWVIKTRCWSVLLGMFLTALAAIIILLPSNPAVFTQYLLATGEAPSFLLAWATPTLGTGLRVMLGVDKTWLQIMPTAVGFIWLLGYWIKHHRTWDWAEQMPLLLLVSLVTAFYEWGYDQVVLLVGVIQACAGIFTLKKGWGAVVIIISYFLINSVPLIFPVGNEFWYIWMAPSFLLWYLLVRRQVKLGN